MFRLYVVITIVGYLIWTTLFVANTKTLGKIRKNVSKQSDRYKRIDKRVVHAEQLKVLADIERYKKWKLVSPNLLTRIRPALNTLGVNNVEAYVHKSIQKGFAYAVTGITIIVGASLSTTFLLIMTNVDFSVVSSLLRTVGLGYLVVALLSIFYIDGVVQKNLFLHVKAVESDFSKLFYHIYPYYTEASNKYQLSEVLSKFSTTNQQMEVLVDFLKEESKKSEEGALLSVIESYSSSIKIVDFASKLLKCVTGNKLGPKYLKSMYDQLIAEEDRIRTEKEQKKYEQYILVMLIGLGCALASVIIGVLIEMV